MVIFRPDDKLWENDPYSESLLILQKKKPFLQAPTQIEAVFSLMLRLLSF